MLIEYLATECQDLGLVGDVAGVARDPNTGWRRPLRSSRRFLRALGIEVAGCDRTACGGELTHQFPPHPRATSRHNRQLPGKRLHTPPRAQRPQIVNRLNLTPPRKSMPKVDGCRSYKAQKDCRALQMPSIKVDRSGRSAGSRPDAGATSRMM
jgi:hypothetical protein